MTTLKKLETLNITINFEIPFECYTTDDVQDMDDAKRDALYHTLEQEYELDVYNIKPMKKDRKNLFHIIGAYFDNQYYYDNIDAFNEYRSHMDEPDFDWDFYSDWHKDMYGFRPH